MATKSALYPTMLDVARRLDPNGAVAKIVELMNDLNPILDDATFVQCNQGVSHKTTVRNGLPTVVWRRAYVGVSPSKSTTTQVTDATGHLEAESVIDEMILAPQLDKSGFRLSEATAFIEAMNQEFAQTLFYGNSGTDPDEFTGLGVRFSEKSTDETKTGYNIIDGGGTGATNTSIFIVGWGPRSVHCIYPQGSTVGVTHEDEGLQRVPDGITTGATYKAYCDRFKWDVGLSVRDWRFVSRIANIDVAKLGAADEADIMDLLIEAYAKIDRRLNQARFAIYCNPTIKAYLDRQTYALVKGGAFTYNEVGGRPVMMFRGIPLRVCDAIVSTEARVV